MNGSQANKVLGVVLAGLGVVSLLGGRHDMGDVTGALFLFLLGVGLVWGWVRTRALWLLVAGACTAALGTFVAAHSFLALGKGEAPLFFLAQAGAFYYVGAQETRSGPWARLVAVGLAGLALVIAVAEGVGALSRLILPVVFIAGGVLLFAGKRR